MRPIHGLAQEVSSKSSLAAARAELTAILAATKEATSAATGIASQSRPWQTAKQRPSLKLRHQNHWRMMWSVRNRSSRGKYTWPSAREYLATWLLAHEVLLAFYPWPGRMPFKKKSRMEQNAPNVLRLPVNNESDGSPSHSSSQSRSSES